MRKAPPPRPGYEIHDPVDSPVKEFVEFDFSRMDTGSIYRLIIGSVVPRPIAWVSTVNGQGRVNLAPFSFFNAVSSNPPCVVFSPTFKTGGKEKDTLANIRETKEFVVNMASEWVAEPMHQSSAEYDADVDEMSLLKLTPARSLKVAPPRVQESPVQFECVLEQIVPIGQPAPGATNLVIGRIVMMHVWNEAVSDGKLLIEKLQPISRLGGRQYGRVDGVFELWDADAPLRRKSTLDPI